MPCRETGIRDSNRLTSEQRHRLCSNHEQMKKSLSIGLLSFLLIPVAGWAFRLDPKMTATLDPSLAQVLQSAPTDTIFDLLVAVGDTKQLSQVAEQASVGAHDLKTRHRRIETMLRSLTAKTQSSVLNSLAASAGPRTRVLSEFWITNMMHVQTDRDGLMQLAARADVTRIYVNAPVSLIEPIVTTDAVAASGNAGASLDAVGARDLWARGLTGHGRLVASIDTGVEGIHPALRNSWRGLGGDTAAAWFDPLDASAPLDNNGHGTHVMGTMVGRDGADTIGLAPDAQWITAAVIDRGSTLSATIADILRALQWVADPDGDPATADDVPDVVCNSWGISQTIISPCDSVFFQAIANVEAMGIVCVFAAGNEGPGSMTIRNPADHAASPTSTFSVGAVDPTMPDFPVPSFSSRGPSACDGLSIKPEIAAPGVAIRSSYKGQTYKVLNGTSMAAPHVAAAVALLRQYNPDLTPDEIKLALMSTATDVGDPGADNESGHGMINLPAALAAVPAPSTPTVTVAGASVDAAGDGVLSPGETVDLTVSLVAQGADVQGLLGRLRPLTPGYACPVDTARFVAIPAEETTDITSSPFLVSAAPATRIGDSAYFELSLSGDPLLGQWTDTVLTVCRLPGQGMVGAVDNAQMSLSISNLGLLGMGPGSLIDAGGGWYLTNGGSNLLYEGALMVASAGGRLADASRRMDGASPFDFVPLDSITIGTRRDGAQCASTSFDDRHAVNPVGVTIAQTLTMYSGSSDARLAIVEWTLQNRSGVPIDSLRCGLLLDIDVPMPGTVNECVEQDPVSGGFYHLASGGSTVAGIVPLSEPLGAHRFYQNTPGGKRSFTRGEKLASLQPGGDLPGSSWGDLLQIVASAPVTLAATGDVTFAVALILADSPQQFAQAAGDARRHWQEFTDVDEGEDGGSMLPDVQLNQNFPNPFNPSTVISYSLKRDGMVRLDIINLLGQHVRTVLDGWNTTGVNSVVWDGIDSHGRTVASGVYMYRIETNQGTITKKMVLVR
jgi:bacillopeptidase F